MEYPCKKLCVKNACLIAIRKGTQFDENHHSNFSISDSIIVSEGANTMDIGRTMLPNELPRHRLDAGLLQCYALLSTVHSK